MVCRAISARFRKTMPSGVKESCFWLRSKSWIPSSCSNFLMATVTLGCETCRRSAARVRFRKRAAIWKYSSWRSSTGSFLMRFPSEIIIDYGIVDYIMFFCMPVEREKIILREKGTAVVCGGENLRKKYDRKGRGPVSRSSYSVKSGRLAGGEKF